jgi:hypothetical protein
MIVKLFRVEVKMRPNSRIEFCFWTVEDFGVLMLLAHTNYVDKHFVGGNHRLVYECGSGHSVYLFDPPGCWAHRLLAQGSATTSQVVPLQSGDDPTCV